MPRYNVVLDGEIVETWQVEAPSREEAEQKVRKGKGKWADQRWVDNPQTRRVEEVALS